MGLCRVKTALGISALAAKTRPISGRDGVDQLLDATFSCPESDYMKGPGGNSRRLSFRVLRKKSALPQASFHRPERIFDGLPPLPHGTGLLSRRLCASSTTCSRFQRVIRRSFPAVQLALTGYLAAC